MSYRKRILMIDDVKDSHRVLDGLPVEEYQIFSEVTGEGGLKKAKDLRPDVILLDFFMDPLNGLEICKRLRQNPVTADLPIIMFTESSEVQHYRETLSYANDYIEKGVRREILLAKIGVAARLFRPYPDIAGHQTLTMRCVPGQRLDFHVNQEPGIVSSCGHFEPGELHSLLGEDMQYRSKILFGNDPASTRDTWRRLAKTAGWDLFKKLFHSCPLLLAELRALGERVSKDRLLHLVFECTSDQTRLPLEYLFDSQPEQGGEFLATKHPFARTLIGGQRSRDTISRSWMNEVRRNYDREQVEDHLRVLLIASNTKPDIPGVDTEIALLSKSLKSWFAEHGVPADVTCLPSENACLAEVTKHLQECEYHLVHYAGHGSFSHDKPENSSLFFWSDYGKKGQIVPLTALKLRSLLEGSSVRFIYLSCCFGSTSASRESFLDNDFLGIMDAAHSAQVPAMLGFRWAASDDGAKLLAESFYRGLAKDGELDSALRYARSAVRENLPDDPSWLSPVLITRSPRPKS